MPNRITGSRSAIASGPGCTCRSRPSCSASAEAVAWLQQGRIATYLLYSFVTLLVLLALVLWTQSTCLTQAPEVVAALRARAAVRGLDRECRAWLQNRSAPSLLQPYRGLRKLFMKDAVLADNASPLFRSRPMSCSVR